MLGSSNARGRMFLSAILLSIIFLLTLIIMGTVGANGRLTMRSMQQGCILYMSEENGVVNYNDAYCLMPIIGSAVVAFFALLFLIIEIMVLRKKNEFNPRIVSIALMVMSILLALFSFAMCGEIGIGLNKGCNMIQDANQRSHCRSQRNFSALYAAEICAGLMGGFWLLVFVLEYFQYKRIKRNLGYDAHAGKYGPEHTTVVPNAASTTPRPANASLAQQSEMVYDPTYAQKQQAYVPPHQDPGVHAGPKTELTDTLAHQGDKSEYRV